MDAVADVALSGELARSIEATAARFGMDTVAGAAERSGLLGACVQVIRGSLRLTGATLARCEGAAVEASGGELDLAGVDATGGSAGS